jgi:hypothetical protein
MVSSRWTLSCFSRLLGIWFPDYHDFVIPCMKKRHCDYQTGAKKCCLEKLKQRTNTRLSLMRTRLLCGTTVYFVTVISCALLKLQEHMHRLIPSPPGPWLHSIDLSTHGQIVWRVIVRSSSWSTPSRILFVYT